MPSTYSSRLRLELQANGENAGSWGDITNTNLGTLLETSIAGYRTIAMPDAEYTLTTANGLDDEARYAILNFTGTLTATRKAVIPAVSKTYTVINNTNQTLQIGTAAGAVTTVGVGFTALVYCNGTDSFNSVGQVQNLSVAGTLNVAGATTLATASATNLSYTGTFTGGTGVVNIGSGQLYKSEAGFFGFGKTDPEFKIDISAGNVGVRHKSSATVGAIRVDSTGVGGGGQFEAYQNGSAIGAFGAAGAFTGVGSDNVSVGAARSGGGVDVYTNGTATLVARFFASGQFSVGLPTSLAKLSIETSNASERVGYFRNSAGTGVIQLNSNTNSATLKTLSGGGVTIGTDGTAGDTEGLRLTGNRFFKASNTGSYGSVAGLGNLVANDSHNFQSDQNNTVVAAISSSTGAAVSCFDAFLPTSAAGSLFKGSLNAVTQYNVAANGNVTNTNNSYGAISDAKKKTVIGPASSYWERYKLIEWVKFTLKDDPANQEQLGVIAQQVRDVFPGLIEETPDMVDVVKTREVTKEVRVTRTETQESTRTEIVFENGEYIQKTIVESLEVQVPEFDEFDLKDESGEVIGVHKVPCMTTVTETETYTEKEPNGEVTLSVKYSVLGHISDVIMQEVMARIEALEAK